jgi:transcriptional regulator with PAS, ATPase and Fis domain
MRSDMNELKKLVHDNLQKNLTEAEMHSGGSHVMPKYVHDVEPIQPDEKVSRKFDMHRDVMEDIQDTQEIIEESLSLADKEIELIRKALDRHNGKRKYAAGELGISERTLYRKIKEYNIE